MTCLFFEVRETYLLSMYIRLLHFDTLNSIVEEDELVKAKIII